MALGEDSYPAGRHDLASDADELREIQAALDVAPRGALAVSAISVGLLMACWLIIYIFVFLPRGTVG
jgi:hypothetical protein